GPIPRRTPHRMTESLQALLAGVIDYAGLFPPAQLPFESAFSSYLRYRDGPHAWLLGRFVVPAARLDELVRLADSAFGEIASPIEVHNATGAVLGQFVPRSPASLHLTLL